MFGKVGPPVDEESADLPVSRVGENRRDEEERKLVTVANTFRSLDFRSHYMIFLSPGEQIHRT